MTDELKYDRSLLGVEHELGSFTVTSEMIVDFARALLTRPDG